MGATGPTSEPRQRWRLTYRRAASTRPSGSTDRSTSWEAALAASALPLARVPGTDRPRLVLGPPLPVGVAGEREVTDVLLTERLPIAEVRADIAAIVPDGDELVGLADVWLGAPSLAADAIAAVYRVELAEATDLDALTTAARGLLAAPAVERTRVRGDRRVTYDLRPLVEAIEVVPGSPPALRLVTRFDPVRGVGRPDEVVAALEERLGRPVEIGTVAREGLVLASEASAGV